MKAVAWTGSCGGVRARQGDPGTTQFYVSLEDDLMRMFGSDRIASLMDKMGYKEGEVIQHSMVTKSIERAQKKVEENNFGIRKRLLEYDDVMNKQRNVVYKKRNHALFGDRLRWIWTMRFISLRRGLSIRSVSRTTIEGFKLSTIVNFGVDTQDRAGRVPEGRCQSTGGKAIPGGDAKL